METLLDFYRTGGWRRLRRELASGLLTIVVVMALAAIPLTLRYLTFLPPLP